MDPIESPEVANAAIHSPFGGNTMIELLVRMALNLLVIMLLVRWLYYSRYKNKDFVFTFFLFNVVNFLICFLLSGAKLKTGFAFGLFAIFSIIRYRTVTVPVREMGYFFICVAIGIINALAPIGSDKYDLLLANAFLVGLTFVLERGLNIKHENIKQIRYERIDLVVPEKHEVMIEDLKKRTGLPIHRVEILDLDFMRDVARINAFYYSNRNETSSAALGGGDSDD